MLSAMPLKKSARIPRIARPSTMPRTPVVASTADSARSQLWRSITAMPTAKTSTATNWRSSPGARMPIHHGTRRSHSTRSISRTTSQVPDSQAAVSMMRTATSPTRPQRPSAHSAAPCSSSSAASSKAGAIRLVNPAVRDGARESASFKVLHDGAAV